MAPWFWFSGATENHSTVWLAKSQASEGNVGPVIKDFRTKTFVCLSGQNCFLEEQTNIFKRKQDQKNFCVDSLLVNEFTVWSPSTPERNEK